MDGVNTSNTIGRTGPLWEVYGDFVIMCNTTFIHPLPECNSYDTFVYWTLGNVM